MGRTWSIYIVLLVCLSLNAFAQQDPQISQYMFNNSSLNPAAAGSNGGNITLFYRNQWVNYPGGSKTIGFVGDIAIPKTPVGVGLNLFNTSQGALSFARVQTNYSYKINIKPETAVLHLGLQAGVVQYSVNTSDLRLHDDISQDQTFNSASLRKMIPDFGFGAFLRIRGVYFGAALPHLLQSKIKFINQVVDTTVDVSRRNNFSKIFRHYYFTAGGNVKINTDLVLQPSIILKYVMNAPLAADINANLTYKEMYWAGLGYRIGKPGAYVFMAGLTFKKFKLGYAFDMTNSALGYVGTSHEIMLNYRFIEPVKLVKASKKPYFLK